MKDFIRDTAKRKKEPQQATVSPYFDDGNEGEKGGIRLEDFRYKDENESGESPALIQLVPPRKPKVFYARLVR